MLEIHAEWGKDTMRTCPAERPSAGRSGMREEDKRAEARVVDNEVEKRVATPHSLGALHRRAVQARAPGAVARAPPIRG